MRTISSLAANYIKSFEGLRLTAYICPAGKPTIGWGHTKGVTHGDVAAGKTITRFEAQRLFEQDVAEAIGHLERYLGKDAVWAMPQGVLDAAVSLIFNVGPNTFRFGSASKKTGEGSFFRSLRERNWKQAADTIQLYNKGGKPLRIMPGLVKRRAEEARWIRQGYGTGAQVTVEAPQRPPATQVAPKPPASPEASLPPRKGQVNPLVIIITALVGFATAAIALLAGGN